MTRTSQLSSVDKEAVMELVGKQKRRQRKLKNIENFAIMSVDKEAVMELVGSRKKAKKKAESDEYGFLENADENAKKVIKGMFENVADGREVVVEFAK